MAFVMERIGHLFINLQQVREVPRMLIEAIPPKSTTLKDSDVPDYFREQYVYSGYRPLHQTWRYYFLSLFQRHNETINIWTHLLGVLVIFVKLRQLAETTDFVGDPHSWPLLILTLSGMIYMALSAMAHLLGGRSELCHYIVFFLDYLGVAQYQYGSAFAHFYYAVEESWYGQVRGIFMPTAAFLSWLSFLGCCYGKYYSHSLPAYVRTVGQVVPAVLAYAWDTSPIFQRLSSWSVAGDDQALVFHLVHVSLFLTCAFFFTCHLPERWLPGRCDFAVQSHQLFHVLLIFCTLSQVHASYLDYLHRRALYSRLHGSGDAALFTGLYVANLVICVGILVHMVCKVKALLDCQAKTK